MSEINNGGLDQYGTEAFEQQQFGTAGVEGVNPLKPALPCTVPASPLALALSYLTVSIRCALAAFWYHLRHIGMTAAFIGLSGSRALKFWPVFRSLVFRGLNVSKCRTVVCV